ncbi:MAG: cation efflux family transporter [Desulfuromonas sp.]|nr:MAG: cation efflux family transporter [Desulfuromonas sp.]
MSHAAGSPIKAIYYAFFANLGIALCKGGAAFFTGSSSLLAESIHSCADTGNQLLLLLGLRRAQRPANAEHPLGYGKVVYFWSFIVAMLLFSVGGLFSVYEGWHKWHHPEPLQNAWVGLVVLGVSILLEGASLVGCLREITYVRKKISLWQWLFSSRNSELLVVFGEDVAALFGLALAFIFLSAAVVTGHPSYDACGSICIGLLLIVVAIFLAVRIKELLIGRSADPDLVEAIETMIAGDADILELYNVITLQMGAKVMLAAKLRVKSDLSVEEACVKINRLEKELKQSFPSIGWSFIEPDIER